MNLLSATIIAFCLSSAAYAADLKVKPLLPKTVKATNECAIRDGFSADLMQKWQPGRPGQLLAADENCLSGYRWVTP